MLRRTMLGITGLVLLLGQVSAQGQATATVAAQVNQQVPEIIKLVGEAKAYDDAAGKARALFDYVVAFNPSRDTASFVEAAYVDRLTRQLVKAQPAVRDKAAAILLKYPDLARALVFTAQPADKPEQFLPVLVKLHDAHGQKIGKYPALTAALCLVHDQPLEIHINENLVKAPDPVALFDFYMTHRRKMLFGLTRVPTELMVWIVDSTATIKDMQWAVDNYAGDREVGARFFDIEYDYDHLRRGTPKKVTQKGFSLPNICKYGGVCADQAYFAAAVGKSIGVPTAYVTGRSGTVGHAWVGFVQAQGRKGVWNFDKGRYPEYQAVRGVVYHPQTRQMVSDSYVALLAELIGTPDAQRYTAIAMTDAVMRLRELAKDGQVNVPYVGAAEGDGRPPMVRSASAEDQLALLETGLRACPGYANAWYAVSALANEKKLSMGQIRTWAAMVQRLTGQKYPDFTMDILKPMIAAVNSPIDQNALWDSAFRFVQRRTDLAAEVRLAQGLLWEAEGEIRKAGKCYEDVINRYVNAGPFVLTALEKTAAMLTESGKTEKIVMLYATTWKRTEKPSSMAGVFMEQSNWYQIGKAYAQQLRAAGNAAEAAKVEKQISS